MVRAPFRLQLALTLTVFLVWPGTVRAQSVSTSIDPVVPVDFERGRNISVTKTIDPHFSPVGVRAGSFQIFPSISLASGATDNVYVNNDVKVSDALFTLKPQLQVLSEWSRHRVTLNANADLVRYAHQTLRNREEYSLAASGTFDIFSTMAVKAVLDYDRRAESPYLNDLSSNVSVLSQYSRFNPSLSFAYTAGHTRLTVAAEHYGFRFNTVSDADGSVRDQSERNRDIERLALQADYAFTPSVAVYVQINGDHTNYLSLRSDGTANRDADTVRVIGGVALDMAGLLRGKIAAGYTKKNYIASRYKDPAGLTVDSSLELFVSPLTTVTVAARSSFQDINNNVTNGAYRDVTLSAGIDHALLRNLLLSAKATHIQRSPVETNDRLGQSIGQIAFEGAYQADRYTILSLSLGYGRGRPTNGSGSVSFDELRGQVAIQLRL